MKFFRLFKAKKPILSSENKVFDVAQKQEPVEPVNETQKANKKESTISNDDKQPEELPSFSIFDIEKLGEIKDIKILTRIAIESDSFIVATAAVELINDESALVEIARGSNCSFVRNPALDKLSDEGLLLIAKESTGKAFSDIIFSEVSKRIKNATLYIELLNIA